MLPANAAKGLPGLKTQPNSQLLLEDHSSTQAEKLHPTGCRGKHPDVSGPSLEMTGTCKTWAQLWAGLGVSPP